MTKPKIGLVLEGGGMRGGIAIVKGEILQNFAAEILKAPPLDEDDGDDPKKK